MNRAWALTVLALALSLPPALASAQEEPSPLPSPGAEVLPLETAGLGGGWRRTPVGPFGAIDMPGGWTGTEVVVVDPDQKRRAATYNPGLDLWDQAAPPPWKLSRGAQGQWTGTELLFVEPRGAARRGLAAYDPLADAWRRTARSPINEIASSAWAERVLVVTSAAGRTAAYDPVADAWTELPPLPMPQVALDDLPLPTIALSSTGGGVLALTSAEQVVLTPLDLEAMEWGQASVGPLTAATARPLWTGEDLVFLSAPPADVSVPELEAPSTDVRYRPVDEEWSVIENPCGIDTSDAVWTDRLILAVGQGQAYDPATGECYTLPPSPWAERTGALDIWTGHELLQLSGTTDGKQPGRGGIAYDPFPGDDALGVAVDKPSRPVRVRVPSLGIDLPIVWDGRKVRGASPGAVPCDVALTWSPFDLPGAPGTSWVLAHAQEGMFLPLLETLETEGKQALLGHRVELQLRDGRLFTYRTYRVNPRATNTAIGFKGRTAGEHRLVLQTSTGVGSAPKLLVAARLVDVGTTDEPRPRPNPRACG